MTRQKLILLINHVTILINFDQIFI